MVHAVHQQPRGARVRRGQTIGILDADLQVVLALHDEHGHVQASQHGSRVIAEPRDEVGLHGGPEHRRERGLRGHRLGQGVHPPSGSQATHDVLDSLQRRPRQLRPELPQQGVLRGHARAFERDEAGHGRTRRDERADEGAFAVADDRDLPVRSQVCESLEPVVAILDEGFQPQLSFGRWGAGAHATLVEAQARDARACEACREQLEAVVPAGQRSRVAIPVGGA